MDKRMLAVMIILLVTFTGFGLIIPIMPVVVNEAGATEFHLALMLSLYSAASFFLSPVWGAISDRIGRRPVIMAGLLGYGVSFLLFGLAGNDLGLMYLSRILGGIFSGAAVSSTVAYAADITSAEERTKAMGLVGMSIGLGFIFGPAIGGIFGSDNYALPFFLAAGLSFLMFLYAWRYLRESLRREAKAAGRGQGESRLAAFAGPLKYLYGLSFFVSFTLAGLESTFQYFEMYKFGATPEQIGIMFALIGIIGAAVQGGVVRRIRKGKEPAAIVIGIVFTAAGFFSIMFSFNFWSATLFVAIFGIGNALLRPSITSLITQKTKVGQGVASGFNSSMDSLGRITGPLLGGALFELNQYYPFVANTLLSLLAFFLVYGYFLAERKPVGAAERR